MKKRALFVCVVFYSFYSYIEEQGEFLKNIKIIADSVVKRAMSDRQCIQSARLMLLNLAKNMPQSNPILCELKKVVKMLMDLEFKI